MTRSAARRPAGVQTEKSPSAPPSAPGPEAPSPAPAGTAGVPWYWRLVMFLWITSFIFLLLYEWLAGILKSWAASNP